MSKREILLMAEALSNEKGVSREVIFSAIEAALAIATKKRYDFDLDIRVSINRDTGDYETFRCFTVLADDTPTEDQEGEVVFDPQMNLRLSDAKSKNPHIILGGKIEDSMPSIEFSRIDAQLAKRVIFQEIHRAIGVDVANRYSARIGTLITGIVKKVTHSWIVLDLGEGVEALIPREEMIPKEAVRNGDRVRGYLYDVRLDAKNGVQLFVSRTHPQMVARLFEIEVPEIGEGLIEIKSAARDPGLRAKIAVKTNDRRIDPVGACVGMRGARVQAVSGELVGERVDIVLWDDNPVQFVINAMSPAEVTSIVVDEEAHSMDIAVQEENLPQAIGRNGQNVRLASQLSGWNLNVMSIRDAEERTKLETETLQTLFIEQLGVDEEIAEILIEQGFSSIEEIAYVPTKDLVAIPGFDEELAEELRNRAKDTLLTRALATEEKDETPADDLLALEGMTPELAFVLVSNAIKTREDLAEKSIDDLMEIENMDEATAAKLIMAARAHWFE